MNQHESASATLPLFLETDLPEQKSWILDSVQQVLDAQPNKEGSLYLNYSARGLELIEVGPLKPLRVDFLEGELRHKRRQGIGKNSLPGKALGLSKGYKKILDGTLGLGQDSWMFLCMGLNVTAVERSLPVFLLTKDGLERAEQDEELSAWISHRLKIQNSDVFDLLSHPQSLDVDLIFFDFMFPEKKKALPRKSMQLLAKLDLGEVREQEIVLKALKTKAARVVVKRPLKASPILDNPQHTYEGNSIRYDVYIK